jgi:frataxin-like iron-binding protein CyaY
MLYLFRCENSEDQKLVVRLKDVGDFEFIADSSSKTIYYSSPFSGITKYIYDTSNECWISNRDGHFLFDNLLREITKSCSGLLEL